MRNEDVGVPSKLRPRFQVMNICHNQRLFYAVINALSILINAHSTHDSTHTRHEREAPKIQLVSAKALVFADLEGHRSQAAAAANQEAFGLGLPQMKVKAFDTATSGTR